MLILHLFGTEAALDRWLHVNVVPSSRLPLPKCSPAHAEVHYKESPLAPTVSIRAVVIRDQFDVERLIGLRPDLVIQDDSFLALGHRVRSFVDVYFRR